MKILSGRLKGQKLYERLSPGLRPTADKTRKAILDILKDVISESRVLDLYSGTGALGIEALSMGAESVVFVEMDRLRCLRIRDNLKRLGVDTKATTLCEDALRFISKERAAGSSYPLIFADPPYREGHSEKLLEALGSSTLLAVGGYFVLECHRKEDMPDKIGSLEARVHKTYGDTKVLVYQRA